LGATGGRRDLERRLVMIMRGPASRRLSWVGLVGAIALGLLALPAWTLGEDKAPLPTVSTPPPMAVTEGPPAPPTAADPLTVHNGALYQPVTTYRKVTTVVPVTSYRLVQPGAATSPTPVQGVPATPASPGPALTAVETPAQALVTPAANRDRKLKELEDKVQQLLKEMQQLRGQAPTTQQETLNGLIRSVIGSGLAAPAPAPPRAQVEPTPFYPPYHAAPAPDGAEVITLTRVSYKLNPTTAYALVDFLKDNVKTAILEAKSEGENLVVTTTPDAQKAIGQFIHLLQGPTALPTPKKSRVSDSPKGDYSGPDGPK
jgi:hypothetical protein